MRGLLYKDWSVLAGQYRKNILLLLVVYLGMAYLFDMPFMLYALVFMLGIYTQSAVSFDEKSHWDMYAHTLPVSPAAIIGSKYLLGLLAIAGGFLIGLAAFLFFPDIARGTMGMEEALVGMLAATALALLYFSLSLPLSYQLGSERARTAVMVVILLLAVLATASTVLLSSEQLQDIQRFFGFRGPAEIWDSAQEQTLVMDVEYGSVYQWARNLHFWWLIVGGTAGSALLYAGSWLVSIAIYKHKQF